MSETRPDPQNAFPLDFDLASDLTSDLDPELETSLELDEKIHELPLPSSLDREPVSIRSLTNSPGCEPRRSASGRTAPVRRPRTVRVDAWAEPAPTSWSRTRTTVRKVSRASRSTDWALPF